MIEDELNAYLCVAERYHQSQADLIRHWHNGDKVRDDPQVRALVLERDRARSRLKDIESSFGSILKSIPGGMKKREGIRFIQMHSQRGW